jgi:LmbE family N-acetylglucosaminyl deacetylase
LAQQGLAGGGKRALVIAAHPDDAEFTCAGTAALWIRDGWEFYYLICSDGSKGTDDLQLSRERLAAMRQGEQQAAAAVLGVKEVSFLNHEDGELIYQRELMREIERHVRRVRPHVVFTHEPVHILGNKYLNHPDHRTVGTVVLDAVYPIVHSWPSFPEHTEEGLEPHRVGELYLWTSNEPNLSVDITDVVGLKFQALIRHRSQFTHIAERMIPRFCRGVPILSRVASSLFWFALSRSFSWFVLSRIKPWRRRWADKDGRFRENFRRIELPY